MKIPIPAGYAPGTLITDHARVYRVDETELAALRVGTISAVDTLYAAVDRKIASRDGDIAEIAISLGQKVENVSHMRFFRDAVAAWLVRNTKIYFPLQPLFQ